MELNLTSEQRGLFVQYKDEAFNYLTDEETAKSSFKEVVETVAKSTGLEKALVAKFYRASRNSKVQGILEEAEAIRFLSEGPSEQVE